MTIFLTATILWLYVWGGLIVFNTLREDEFPPSAAAKGGLTWPVLIPYAVGHTLIAEAIGKNRRKL